MSPIFTIRKTEIQREKIHFSPAKARKGKAGVQMQAAWFYSPMSYTITLCNFMLSIQGKPFPGNLFYQWGNLRKEPFRLLLSHRLCLGHTTLPKPITVRIESSLLVEISQDFCVKSELFKKERMALTQSNQKYLLQVYMERNKTSDFLVYSTSEMSEVTRFKKLPLSYYCASVICMSEWIIIMSVAE